jgi:hypothetical protein
MAREQRCPEVERLQVLIKQLREQDIVVVDVRTQDVDPKGEEITEALMWLKDFLLNRRNYQRKQQVKKKVMMRIISEHDLASILDENIKATYGDNLERFDDNNDDE